MDIVGPLPRTKTGKFYILVVSDYFTLTNIEASTVAQTFIFHFVCPLSLNLTCSKKYAKFTGYIKVEPPHIILRTTN